MLTFDNDDNDDNLSLENSRRATPPQKPQQPSSKAPPIRRPGGAFPAANPSPPITGGLPPKKPSPRIPPQNVNSSLPFQAPQPASQPEPQPQVTQPTDQFLLGMMNPGQQNQPPMAQEPQRFNAFENQQPIYSQQQQPQFQPHAEAPTQQYHQQEPSSQQQNQQQQPSVSGKKNKKQKQPKQQKPVPEKSYDGERKKLLWIRIIAGAVAGIILIAGVKAIFLPSSGPSRAQVEAAAQESVNYTGFPTVSGEQFALDFSRIYFNYTTNDQERQAALLNFASEQLLDKIDVEMVSAAEYDAEKAAGAPEYRDYTVTQSIVYGPYIVATENIDENIAVFTVKVGLSSGSVMYYDVPVKYDPENYALTLAGPPSFVQPNQNKGESSPEEYTVDFGSGDKEIQDDFRSDLEEYLSAWGQSNDTIVNRYLVEGATDNAKRGLQNAVTFKSLSSFLVEPYDEASARTETQRRVEITVIWEDPATGLQYPQQYRMLLALNQDNDWSVYDIQNFAILN